MRRLLRLARALLLVAALAALAAGAAAWALLGTERGSAWVLREGAGRAGVALDFRALEGSLLGTLAIDGLEVTAGATRVRVERLALDWRPAALLGARLQIHALGAHGVQVRPPPPEADPAPQLRIPELPALRLPLAVVVEAFELTGLRLGASDSPPLLDRLALRLAADAGHLALDDLAVVRERLRVEGRIGLGLDGDWPLDGRLGLTGQEADTALALDIALAGSARAPQLTVETRAPLQASGTLRADLRGHAPDAELALTWRDAALPATAPMASPEGSLRARLAPADTGAPLPFTVALDAALAGAPSGIRRVTIEADGSIEALEAPYPMDAALRWSVAMAPATFEGAGRVSGDASRIELDHALEQPFRLTTAGSVTPAGVHTAVSLAGEWSDLRWPPPAASGTAPTPANAPMSPSGSYAVEGSLAGLEAMVVAAVRGVEGLEELEATLSGRAEPRPPHAFEAAIEWRAATAIAGELRGSGSARGDLARIDFEQRLHGPGSVHAAGSVTLGPELALDVHGAWSELRWPPEGDSRATSASGTFSARGALDALATRIEAEAEAAPVGPLALRARATVSPAAARDLDLELELLGGSVRARGAVGWARQPSAQMDLTARALDPGRLHPQAAGSLGGRVLADITLGPDGPGGHVTLESLDGTLGGYPVRGEGSVELVAGGFDARALELRTGDNTLSVSGRVADTLSLDYRVQAPDLSQLWPGLAGAVSGQGQVRGTPATPVVEADLEASGLRAGDVRAARVSLDADVDLSRGARSAVRARATGIAAAGQAIAGARLDLEGSLPRHRLQVEVDAASGRLSLAASGALDGDAWAGELAILEAQDTPLGDWRLERAVALAASPAGIESGDACLASDGARLCLRAGRADGQSVRAQLSSLPVARFSSWLPQRLAITGALDATLSASRRQQDPWQADATVTATPTRLRLEQEDGAAPLELRLDDTRIEARHDAGGTVASLASRLAGDGSVRGELRLGPADGAGAPALSGRVDAALPDLAPFQALVPALTELAGRLQAGLDLAGTLERPQVSGSVQLAGARAGVAAAGITVERTAITVRGDAGGGFSLDGTLHSGPGSISLSGEGRLGADGYQARIRARGERFEAVRLVPVQALVSPDLVVEADPSRIAVTGSVHVPEATVSIQEVPPDVVQVSEDETIVGRESRPAPAWRERLDVKVAVSLGDAVHVDAFGLDAGLAGGLDLAVAGTAPPTARGTVTLEDGRFTAYGQDLEVRRGRLLFAGPLDNPGLDLRAVRDAGEVVAGIEVSGSADDMRSRLFSEPPLPEAEALAWLLTGRGLSGASSSDGTALAGAALALGLERSDQITRQIGSALGLDELAVAPGGGLNESALVLGKSLTPRLYIRYALGVLDRQGSVQVDYKLTDRISVEAESGARQGADVIYRLER